MEVIKLYNTIIFDLDGTLLDTLIDLANSVNFSLSKHNLPIRTQSEVRSYLGNGILKLMEHAVQDGQDNPNFGAAFQDFKEHYLANCNIKTKPYTGIMELLSELKGRGIKLAIVSNKHDTAVKSLCRLHFSDYIEVAIGESKGIKKKPAPDTVMQALEKLGSNKETAIYVGDSEVDFHTALNTGMDCVLVSWGFRDREQLEMLGASLIIDKPSELLKLI